MEVAAVFTALKGGFEAWGNHKDKSFLKNKVRIQAIELVLEAVCKTRAYLYDRDVLGDSNRVLERDLSMTWQKVASAVECYDEELFRASQVKSLGWGDPRRWENWRKGAKTIDLDTIEKQCKWLKENDKLL